MRQYGLLVAALLPLLAGGCVRSAANLAALPVRSTQKMIDWSTTSREEADRNEWRAQERAFDRRNSAACAYRDGCDGAIHFDRRPSQ